MLKYNDKTIGIGHIDLSDITEVLSEQKNNGFLQKNLFDKTAITPNVKYATDGTTVRDTNWGLELIKVEPSTKYAITSSKASGYFIEFDTDNAFIKYYHKTSQTITTSDNCEYLGVGIVTNSTLANYDLDTFQLERGEVATGYAPFAKSNVELEEEIDSIENQVFSKNLLNLDKMSNGWLQEDGTESPSTQGNYVTEYIEIEGGETYYLSRVHGTSSSICWYDKDKNFISGHAYNGVRDFSIVAPSNAKYTRFTVQIAYADEMMLEKGSAKSSYVSYAKSNSEITNDIEQKERELLDLKMLGWTVPKVFPIKNYYDSTSGIFHQRVARVDMGSLVWEYDSSMGIFVAPIDDRKQTIDVNVYCHKYGKAVKTAARVETKEMPDKTFAYFYLDTETKWNTKIHIKDSSYTDLDTFKTAMSGEYVYYELATEVTKSVDGNEAVEELNSSLNYCVGFPNISSSAVLHTFSTNESWTATENCWIIGTIRYVNSTQGDNDSSIKVNSIYVQTAYCSTGNVLTNVSMPISKGDVVSTSTYGTFNALKAYKCK